MATATLARRQRALTTGNPLTADLDRRQLLARALFGSLGAVAGLSTFHSEVEAAGQHRIVFDIAVLGNTFTFLPAPGATDHDTNWRGSIFFVEGNLYPRDTIPAGVTDWDPSSATPIGHWFGRGCSINRTGRPGEEDRPEPFSIMDFDYVFGRIVPDALFPRDQLMSSGLTGTGDPMQRSLHAVVGGTGRYHAAQGDVRFQTTGFNLTGGPNVVHDFRLLDNKR
jgi:hypothetical protein